MKLIKMIGLAAMAALMAMAFAGASSAMAESTALCDLDPGTGSTEVCPSGHLASHVHAVTLSGHKAVLKTSILTVECDVLFLGDTKSAGNLGAPLKIVGNFTYTNCGSCTVTEVTGSTEIKVTKLGHETADVAYEYEVHLNCGSSECTYNSKSVLGTAKGPLLSSEANGGVTSTEQEMQKVSGLFCPSTAKLTITTTLLDPAYLTN